MHPKGVNVEGDAGRLNHMREGYITPSGCSLLKQIIVSKQNKILVFDLFDSDLNQLEYVPC